MNMEDWLSLISRPLPLMLISICIRKILMKNWMPYSFLLISSLEDQVLQVLWFLIKDCITILYRIIREEELLTGPTGGDSINLWTISKPEKMAVLPGSCRLYVPPWQ